MTTPDAIALICAEADRLHALWRATATPQTPPMRLLVPWYVWCAAGLDRCSTRVFIRVHGEPVTCVFYAEQTFGVTAATGMEWSPRPYEDAAKKAVNALNEKFKAAFPQLDWTAFDAAVEADRLHRDSQ